MSLLLNQTKIASDKKIFAVYLFGVKNNLLSQRVLFGVWGLFRMLKLKGDTMKPLPSGPPIKRTPSIKRTLNQIPKLTSCTLKPLLSGTPIKRTLGKVPMVST